MPRFMSDQYLTKNPYGGPILISILEWSKFTPRFGVNLLFLVVPTQVPYLGPSTAPAPLKPQVVRLLKVQAATVVEQTAEDEKHWLAENTRFMQQKRSRPLEE